MDTRALCCECGDAHSATSAHYDMAIDNNGTWRDAWQFDDEDDLTWTLDGTTFLMDVQLNYYDAVPKLSLRSQDNEIIVADTVKRVIYLNVDPSAIQSALTPGVYVYDLIMIDGSGVRTPLLHGYVKVAQGVTYP